MEVKGGIGQEWIPGLFLKKHYLGSNPWFDTASCLAQSFEFFLENIP